MYLIKKAKEYFFPNLNADLLEVKQEILGILNNEEKDIFSSMPKYDQKHSIEVYIKVRNNPILKEDILYKKLAALHDCGKKNAKLLKRIAHKIGLNTSLRTHPENGYMKLRNIDEALAILIKHHHSRNYSIKMTEFQKLDDLS